VPHYAILKDIEKHCGAKAFITENCWRTADFVEAGGFAAEARFWHSSRGEKGPAPGVRGGIPAHFGPPSPLFARNVAAQPFPLSIGGRKRLCRKGSGGRVAFVSHGHGWMVTVDGWSCGDGHRHRHGLPNFRRLA
jgi:hypothetical protein